MATVMSIEEIDARLDELRGEIKDLDNEFVGQALPDDKREVWNQKNEELEHTIELRQELVARTKRVAELAEREVGLEEGASFQTARPGRVAGDDIYDLSTIRMTATSMEDAHTELRDRAMRSVESAVFPHPHAKREDCQSHIARLLDSIDGPGAPGEDKIPGELARRILSTGSPVYKRAFSKYLRGLPYTNEEARALSVGTGSAGGFAIVYQLDPTIIPTSNGIVNPVRAIANISTIAGTNEWRGVTSGAVTASRVAEATEATDNSPTLAQPALIVTKAHVFIPFSVEVGADWSGLEAELARLIQDAKDVEEGTAFVTGNGTTPNPQGFITGASNTTTAGGTAAFAVADVYKVWEALPPRFRPNAKWVSNLFTYDKIRQFDTAGGASLFVPNLQMGFSNQGMKGSPDAANLGYALLNRPAYESSIMASALTTGQKIMAVGDFDYYKVVDRVGLDIEVIPQLFGLTAGYPTGQRGIYAYWRNYGKTLSAAAFQVLVTG